MREPTSSHRTTQADIDASSSIFAPNALGEITLQSDATSAVTSLSGVIESFIPQFEAQLFNELCHKIGLTEGREGDADLINRLLAAMQVAGADFTLTFRRLALAAESSNAQSSLRELFAQAQGIDDWVRDWRKRLASDPQCAAEAS